MEGPHTKFCENHSCEVQTNVMKIGANEVDGLGIKNISLAKNLTKSATIWKAPFRPINTGPTRRMTYAKILRSDKAINSRNNIDRRQIKSPVSLIVLI